MSLSYHKKEASKYSPAKTERKVPNQDVLMPLQHTNAFKTRFKYKTKKDAEDPHPLHLKSLHNLIQPLKTHLQNNHEEIPLSRRQL